MPWYGLDSKESICQQIYPLPTYRRSKQRTKPETSVLLGWSTRFKAVTILWLSATAQTTWRSMTSPYSLCALTSGQTGEPISRTHANVGGNFALSVKSIRKTWRLLFWLSYPKVRIIVGCGAFQTELASWWGQRFQPPGTFSTIRQSWHTRRSSYDNIDAPGSKVIVPNRHVNPLEFHWNELPRASLVVRQYGNLRSLKWLETHKTFGTSYISSLFFVCV